MSIKIGSGEISANGKRVDFGLSSSFSLTLYIAETLPNASHITSVHADTDGNDCVIVEFDGGPTKLVITLEKSVSLHYYHFSWTTGREVLADTVYLGDLTSTQWYGGPFVLEDSWPLLKRNKGYDFAPHVVNDVFFKSSGWDRYWLCSAKAAFVVPDAIPLFTKVASNGYLNLKAQYNDVYEGYNGNSNTLLSYTIVLPADPASVSLAEFHSTVSKIYVGNSKHVIDSALIEKPIWTTWNKFGKAVDQKQLLEFADEISFHEFPVSQIELDDAWCTAYGDFEVNRTKFPNLADVSAKLKAKKIRLSAWVHPFINLNSANGQNPDLHKYFVQTRDGKPGVTNWWDGKQAYIVDFTNPEAYAWYRDSLKDLQSKYGIYTYKFDAGEVYYLPSGFKLFNSSVTPDDFSKAYTKLAVEFGSAVENRVGTHGTQAINYLVRTPDRGAYWNDFQTVLPFALHFSLLGYYWNLPDIIGGIRKAGVWDKEIFIRWVQLNAFLPVMQFSDAPWDFSSEPDVLIITRHIMKTRSNYINYIKTSAKKSVKASVPLIRPLWWQLDTPEAYACDDEFFVGDRLLVAPVIHQGALERKVILPAGNWKDDHGDVHAGPLTLTVDAPLNRLPYFWREDNDHRWCNCSVV